MLAGALALVMRRSADGGLISVGARAVSSAEFVSVTPVVETCTVFVTVVSIGVVLFTLTVSVIVLLTPTASPAAIGQEIEPLVRPAGQATPLSKDLRW